MTEQIKNERLRNLRAKVEAAGRRFDEGKRRLYQANGDPLFAEDVMKAELEKLARERNAVLFEVEEEVREIAADSSGILERLQNADPIALLSEEELARANARRGFANDEADSLSASDLARRLESVLHAGDRASIAAYLLAGRRRRGAILERRKERAEARSGNGVAAPPSYEASTPLDETLDALEKALGGEKREAELEAAKAIGREAFEVESTAHSLRYEGRSFAEVHALQSYAVPGPYPEAGREKAREMERLARVR